MLLTPIFIQSFVIKLAFLSISNKNVYGSNLPSLTIQLSHKKSTLNCEVF